MDLNCILKKKINELTRDEMSEIVVALINKFTIEYELQDRQGIYATTTKAMAYNSNRIEGSTLTQEQTSSLFDTGTLIADSMVVYKAKDIEEMRGHFRMFNYMLKHINEPLSEEMIKKYHFELKNGVFEDLLNGYMVGDYKTRVNRVSDITVANPMDVAHKMSELLDSYSKMDKSIRTVALFHAEYELIHPFQDGNGRTGRMIIFKQCLDNGMIPIIIKDDDKAVYSHALHKAQTESDISLLEELFIRKQAEYYDIVREFLYDYSVELNIEDKKRKDSIRKVR